VSFSSSSSGTLLSSRALLLASEAASAFFRPAAPTAVGAQSSALKRSPARRPRSLIYLWSKGPPVSAPGLFLAQPPAAKDRGSPQGRGLRRQVGPRQATAPRKRQQAARRLRRQRAVADYLMALPRTKSHRSPLPSSSFISFINSCKYFFTTIARAILRPARSVALMVSGTSSLCISSKVSLATTRQ